jgi:hypothetical protein
MKAAIITKAAIAAAMLAPVRGNAQTTADEIASRHRAVAAPFEALELTIGTGYTQGFGTLEHGIGMPDIAKAGVGVDASVGFRIDPHFGVALGGQFHEQDGERASARASSTGDLAVRGFALNLAFQYHIDPRAHLDPWVELGAGYRMLWLVPAGAAETTVFYSGPQLVRGRAGLDIRVSPDLALTPLIGADATMFVLRDDVALTAITSPTVSTFVYAGVEGRIDIGGRRR